ncbi:MAG: hypothetical protein ABIK91_06525 [Pseudomonadota bacterium]
MLSALNELLFTERVPRRIDLLVYDLYGLTEEEIQTVEGVTT